MHSLDVENILPSKFYSWFPTHFSDRKQTNHFVFFSAKLKKIAKQIENPTEVIIDFEKNKSSSKLKPISIPTPTPTPSTRSSISSETGSQSGEQSLLDNVLENLMKENGIIDRVFNYFHVDNVIS